MWLDILRNAKDAGVNVIQTYINWWGHEPQRGQLNFEGRYDLALFLRLAAQEGLYASLRIGPYICGNVKNGGFPVWLMEIPGIELRTDNEIFKVEMKRYVENILTYFKANHLMAWQGGPIILLQVENEYGMVERDFGDAGQRYLKWVGELVAAQQIRVPWYMSRQPVAPSPDILLSCNSFYCCPKRRTQLWQPAMWTEGWTAWHLSWGCCIPHRPVQDSAFAIAYWFATGGAYANYYMFYGGTNFEREAGEPFIATSYDYGGLLDEYGVKREPKYSHLRALNLLILQAEDALVADTPVLKLKFGQYLEGYVFGAGLNGTATHPAGRDKSDGGKNRQCVAFLVNIGGEDADGIAFNGALYSLPAWSISILPDCRKVAINTATVVAPTTVITKWVIAAGETAATWQASGVAAEDALRRGDVAKLEWTWISEPLPSSRPNSIFAERPMEQLSLTHDSTDYLWYRTSIQLAPHEWLGLPGGQGMLLIENMMDPVHVFVNGKLVTSAFKRNYTAVNVSLTVGTNEIAILSAEQGKEGAGLPGPAWALKASDDDSQVAVSILGLPGGLRDITSAGWFHTVGLVGEDRQLSSDVGNTTSDWQVMETDVIGRPLTWLRSTFLTPLGEHPVSMSLASMGKGFLWVNGYGLGRYWSNLLSNETDCSEPCQPGLHNPYNCMTGGGQPSQSWFHVPREWLRTDGEENTIILFEEMGGDPLKVVLALHVPSVKGVSSNQTGINMGVPFTAEKPAQDKWQRSDTLCNQLWGDSKRNAPPPPVREVLCPADTDTDSSLQLEHLLLAQRSKTII